MPSPRANPPAIVEEQALRAWDMPSIYKYVNTRTYTDMYLHIYVYVYKHTYSYIHIHTNSYIHMCIYIYAYMHTLWGMVEVYDMAVL